MKLQNLFLQKVTFTEKSDYENFILQKFGAIQYPTNT